MALLNRSLHIYAEHHPFHTPSHTSVLCVCVWLVFNACIFAPHPKCQGAIGYIGPSYQCVLPLLLALSGLATFDLQEMTEKRCTGEGRHIAHHSSLPLSAPPCAHIGMPSDSDLHGHRRCDIIYDIYNILDPLASIMK